jgi:hypothetical protein
MGVDFLAVLLFQAEHQLDRCQVVVGAVAIAMWADELLVGRNGDLAGQLENVSHGFLAIDVLLDDAILIDTDGS